MGSPKTSAVTVSVVRGGWFLLIQNEFIKLHMKNSQKKSMEYYLSVMRFSSTSWWFQPCWKYLKPPASSSSYKRTSSKVLAHCSGKKAHPFAPWQIHHIAAQHSCDLDILPHPTRATEIPKQPKVAAMPIFVMVSWSAPWRPCGILIGSPVPMGRFEDFGSGFFAVQRNSFIWIPWICLAA